MVEPVESEILGKRTHKEATKPVAVGLDMDRVSMEQANEEDIGIEDIIGNGPNAPAEGNSDANSNEGGGAPDSVNPNSVEYNSQGQRITQKTLRGFVSTKDGKPLLFSSRSGKHPKSLWRDE